MCQICQMSSSGECHAEPDTLNDALPSWLINSTGNIKNSNYGSLGGISFDFGRFFFEKPRRTTSLPAYNTSIHNRFDT